MAGDVGQATLQHPQRTTPIITSESTIESQLSASKNGQRQPPTLPWPARNSRQCHHPRGTSYCACTARQLGLIDDAWMSVRHCRPRQDACICTTQYYTRAYPVRGHADEDSIESGYDCTASDPGASDTRLRLPYVHHHMSMSAHAHLHRTAPLQMPAPHIRHACSIPPLSHTSFCSVHHAPGPLPPPASCGNLA